MAFTKRLIEGWTLTDGVFPPFLMDSPKDALSALQSQGLIEKYPTGLGIIRQEWVRLRTYTYSLRFELPEEEAELYAMYFPCLIGDWRMTLNGFDMLSGTSGSAYITLNQHLIDGENLAELEFSPPPAGNTVGIAGDAFLRACSDLYITYAHFAASGNEIRCGSSLTVLSHGKYIFKYTVSLDGEFVQSFEFIERMKAATKNELIHKLKLSDPVRFQPQQPLETSYQVRLSVERMGIGCDQVFQDVCFADAPTRAGRVHGALIYDPEQRERAFQTLREMGADSVVFDGVSALYPVSSIAHGLIPVSAEGFETLYADNALATLDMMKAIAGDMDFWPPDRPVYKFLNSPAFDVQAFEALFGLNACGDAGRCIRLSQRLQAERLFRAAMELRVSGAPAVIDALIDERPRLISSALIESGGAQRPGYDALEAAWVQLCAYVRLPESLSTLTCEALDLECFLINGALPRQLKVSVSVISNQTKQQVASAKFDCDAVGATSIGALSFTTPDSPCALTVRAEVQAMGALLWRHDSLLSVVREGQEPLAPLMNLL